MQHKITFTKTLLASQQGQALIEIAFFLPIMLAISYLILKVSQAIQISITNQHFVREHILYKLHNSPYYPAIMTPITPNASAPNIKPITSNQYIMGMSESALDENQQNKPTTPRYSIMNPFIMSKINIEIRTAMIICTPSYFLTGKQNMTSGIESIENFCSGDMIEDRNLE